MTETSSSSSSFVDDNPSLLSNHIIKNVKRTMEVFIGNLARVQPPEDSEVKRLRLSLKTNSEYLSVKDLPPPLPTGPITQLPQTTSTTRKTQEQQTDFSIEEVPNDYELVPPNPFPSAPGVELSNETAAPVPQFSIAQARQQLDKNLVPGAQVSSSIVEYKAQSSRALVAVAPIQREKPQWHPPWKLMRVISGHHGWVRTVDVDISNEWFCTGAADRTIKIWDLASGTLKLTLTGHISTVRGVVVSDRHPYLFSCGEDKTVKCWDLEVNKVIRGYHGHLSGVYSIAIHPTIDVLITGARDSTARVWDIRTKQSVHVLGGHTNTVADIKTQATDPQIITGSMDTTIRLWDLAAGKPSAILTNHKKSVRSLAIHPVEHTFLSGSADNLKKWILPEGKFMSNFSGHDAVVNSVALNRDNVLVSCADNGSMCFWDWKTGYMFQKMQTRVQPGSLESEAGIFASKFDRSGYRFITCEADKTIKIWKEDEEATPETHPIDWKPTTSSRRW